MTPATHMDTGRLANGQGADPTQETPKATEVTNGRPATKAPLPLWKQRELAAQTSKKQLEKELEEIAAAKAAAEPTGLHSSKHNVSGKTYGNHQLIFADIRECEGVIHPKLVLRSKTPYSGLISPSLQGFCFVNGELSNLRGNLSGIRCKGLIQDHILEPTDVSGLGDVEEIEKIQATAWQLLSEATELEGKKGYDHPKTKRAYAKAFREFRRVEPECLKHVVWLDKVFLKPSGYTKDEVAAFQKITETHLWSHLHKQFEEDQARLDQLGKERGWKQTRQFGFSIGPSRIERDADGNFLRARPVFDHLDLRSQAEKDWVLKPYVPKEEEPEAEFWDRWFVESSEIQVRLTELGFVRLKDEDGKDESDSAFKDRLLALDKSEFDPIRTITAHKSKEDIIAWLLRFDVVVKQRIEKGRDGSIWIIPESGGGEPRLIWEKPIEKLRLTSSEEKALEERWVTKFVRQNGEMWPDVTSYPMLNSIAAIREFLALSIDDARAIIHPPAPLQLQEPNVHEAEAASIEDAKPEIVERESGPRSEPEPEASATPTPEPAAKPAPKPRFKFFSRG